MAESNEKRKLDQVDEDEMRSIVDMDNASAANKMSKTTTWRFMGGIMKRLKEEQEQLTHEILEEESSDSETQGPSGLQMHEERLVELENSLL